MPISRQRKKEKKGKQKQQQKNLCKLYCYSELDCFYTMDTVGHMPPHYTALFFGTCIKLKVIHSIKINFSIPRLNTLILRKKNFQVADIALLQNTISKRDSFSCKLRTFDGVGDGFCFQMQLDQLNNTVKQPIR